MTQNILYVHGAGALVATWKSGGPRIRAQYDLGKGEAAHSHAQQLRALLSATVRGALTIVVDVIDESFVRLEIPQASGADRQAAVERVLRDTFGGHPFTACHTPAPDRMAMLRRRLRESAQASDARGGRPAGAARQEIDLSSLGEVSGAFDWVEAAVLAQARIERVISPAMLAAALARRERLPARCLLVTPMGGGFRQTLLLDGAPAMSRQGPIAEDFSLDAITSELARTINYCMNQRLLEFDALDDDGLTVAVLDERLMSGGAALPDRLTLTGLGSAPLRWLPANKHGLSGLRHARALVHGNLATWLDPRLMRAQTADYAHEALRRPARARAARRTIWAVSSALALTGALACAGVEVIGALPSKAPAALDDRERIEYETLERRLATMPVRGADMRAIVNAVEGLGARRIDTAHLMSVVSVALDGLDPIRVQSLEMFHTAGSGADSGSAAALPTPEAGAQAAVAPAAPGAPGVSGNEPPASEAAAPWTPPVRVAVHGDFADFMPMTLANSMVSQFARNLSVQCGCEATVISPAFETDASQPITVRGQDDPLRRSQTFSIAFSIKPLPPIPDAGVSKTQAKPPAKAASPSGLGAQAPTPAVSQARVASNAPATGVAR